MNLIKINNKYHIIPTEWNELSQKQLLQVMDCLFVKKYTAEQGILKLLKIIANLSWWQFFTAKPTELSEYFHHPLFLLQDQTGFTRQLIPHYKGLYGPSDNLDNLIMQELVFSDSYFMRWAENKDDILMLNELVATLYRPAKPNYDFKRNPDGDPREKFNSNLCSWRAGNEIYKWPLNVKMAIAYWYDACRWQIVEENDEIFGGNGEAAKYGMVSMMMSVAEDGVLGTFNQVEEQYVSLVLMKINESIAAAKELKKSSS